MFIRHKIIAFSILVILCTSLCIAAFSSYKEYRLLFDVQECTNLILNIQQIVPKSPGQRQRVTETYVAIFSSHLERHSQNAAAYLGRAMCYSIAGDYQKAISDLNKTIALAEKSPFPMETLLLLRSQCYIECGEYRQAVEDLEKIKQPDKWVWIGIVYKDFGRYEEAVRIFNKILKRHRYYQRDSILYANVHKAEILTRQKKIDQAYVYAKSAVDMIPYLGGSGFISFYASAGYNALSYVSIKNGNFKKADRYLSEALKWYPADENIMRTLAELESRKGNEKYALELYQGLLRFNGKLHFTLYSYASHFMRQNQLDLAFEYFEKACEHGFSDFSRLKLDSGWQKHLETEKLKNIIAKYQKQLPELNFKF